MTIEELYQDRFFRVRADTACRVVFLIRSAEPFPDVSAIEVTFESIAAAVATVPREWSLLIDSRDAPFRNDPAFESALGRMRVGITSRFARTAVLVKSAMGRLQVARYAREDPSSPRVFVTEAEAVNYLKGADEPRSNALGKPPGLKGSG